MIAYDAAYSTFSYFLTEVYEHPKIQKYIADPDNNDTYEDFHNRAQRPCTGTGFAKMLTRAAGAAGLAELRVHPHMLWHSAGYELASHGRFPGQRIGRSSNTERNTG